MQAKLPIELSPGVRLDPLETHGLARAEVLNCDERYKLPWDRFMRLKVVGDYLTHTNPGCVLDVGGFDGALALFTPHHEVHVVDPVTTGGSGLVLPAADGAYETVVAIDVIEHLPYRQRSTFISELVRVSSQLCLISFPNQATMPAQKLVYSLTGNRFIQEHIEYVLPDKDWVVSEMTSRGLCCEVVPNTSLAIWIAQYTLANLVPDAAQKISYYLTQTHGEEPFSVPLYYLIVGTKSS
ncbi:MAG: class I SAM-dependent methyltransferase [Candidatus Melainabacteria bacterium]|nr:class I SAM-dependent methyltransferase [Candidatus Melainabacteria bacterium]